MGLSVQQIEELWLNSGGSPQSAPTIAAIAEAESGGNPTSLNNDPGTGDYSVGLFQVNYFGNLMTGRTIAYGSPSDLQNSLQRQANAALDISGGGTNFDAWSTYKSGAYQQFLAAADNALPSAEQDVSQFGPKTYGTFLQSFDPAIMTGGGGAATGGSGGTGTLLGFNPLGGGGNSTSIINTPAGSIGIPKGFISRGVIGIVGLMLLYIGIKQLFGSNDGPTVILQGGKQLSHATVGRAKQGAQKGAEAGAAAAAA